MTTYEHEYGVYIGRFQPFHNAHLETVKFALDRVKQLIIVVGSTNCAPNIKNPWTFPERQDMILGCLDDLDLPRITFISARDYLYNDNLWITAIQHEVDGITNGNKDVVLFGHVKNKDTSTFYLKMFNWEFIDTCIDSDIDATKIRFMYFTYDSCYKSLVPRTVEAFLDKFSDVSDKRRGTPDANRFQTLKQEFDHVSQYRKAWACAPFPPTFITTDAIVVKSGHVLIVKRKASPGIGLWALPGGFLNQNERIIDGCIRELKEETGINLPTHELKKCVVDSHVFDHPDRSLRGRTITHAFCVNLGHGELPKVKGGDDAAKAWWIPFNEVFSKENQFFEDHAHIIAYFIHKF